MTARLSSKKLSREEIVDVHRQGVMRKPLDAEAWEFGKLVKIQEAEGQFITD